MQKQHLISIIILVLLAFSFTSCNDNEKFTTDASSILTFSADEIRFDTVISRVGSSTKQFSVYNSNKKGIRASRVYLESGGESGFRVNVDGQYCVDLTDVEVLHDDSIMCFVEITPVFRDQDDPVEVSDHLVFELESGVKQTVTLRASSQDAVFFEPDTITSPMTFTANRPYVFYHTVTVAEGVTVSFEPGATLMFHAGCGMNVKGSIIARGTREHPVTFRGDRTDKMFPYLPYDRLDAQWEGIHIDSISYDNVLDYVDIHGGTYGIVCSPSDTLQQKLTLVNSIIHNVAGHAVLLPNCYSFIGNSQITNALGHCLAVEGGQCTVLYSTIAQFYPWNADRAVALYVANHRGELYTPLTVFEFVNSVVTGYADDDVLFSYAAMQGQESILDYTFANSLVNTVLVEQQQPFFINCKFEDANMPAYKGTNFRTLDTYAFIYDFRLTPGSSARGIADGRYNEYFPLDRNGNERPAEAPDAGCYQY